MFVSEDASVSLLMFILRLPLLFILHHFLKLYSKFLFGYIWSYISKKEKKESEANLKVLFTAVQVI